MDNRFLKLMILDKDIGEKTLRQLSLFQFIYSLVGLIVGVVCILGGVILFLSGITGETHWIANILGAKIEMTDAAPGAILFAVGLLIIFVTRLIIKYK